jgi:hypothetical protein
MGYTKRIVCLANSYKHGGTCIAGRELLPNGYGPWIRPISARPTQELYLSESHLPGIGTPRLLDIVDIAFTIPAPLHHQLENHIVDPAVSWTHHGQLPFAELEKLWQHPPTLWSNTGRTDCLSLEEAIAHKQSLYLLKLRQLTLDVRAGHYTHKKQFRAKFQHAGTSYNFSLTDQYARDRLDRVPLGQQILHGNPALYITISLTEPFAEDGLCYKLVAAILHHPTDRPA